jgi:protein CpxP
MKATRNILTIILLGLYIGVSSAAAAQERHPGPPPIPDEAQITKMIEHLKTELKLDENQAEKIKTLHMEHFRQMKSFQENQRKQMEAAKGEHDKLRIEFDTKIEKELSKEQFEKFKQIREENRKRKHSGKNRPKK